MGKAQENGGADMNREETKKAIEVMQAFVDGVETEYHSIPDRVNWYLVGANPVWSWGADEYRIKPKPREFWLRGDDNYRDGSWHVVPGSGMGAIKVREVL